jgi:hypothetical protein
MRESTAEAILILSIALLVSTSIVVTSMRADQEAGKDAVRLAPYVVQSGDGVSRTEPRD